MDGEARHSKDELPSKKEPGSDTTVGGMEAQKGETLSVAEYLASIASFVKLKQLDRALDQCNEALELFPDNSKLLEKKTKVLCQQHLFQDAFKLVEEWLKLDPKNNIAQREHKKIKIVLSAVEDKDSDEDEEEEEEESEDIIEDVKAKEVSTASNVSKLQDVGGAASLDSNTVAFGRQNMSAFKIFSKQSSPDHKRSEDAGAQFMCQPCDLAFTHKPGLDVHTLVLHNKDSPGEDKHDWCYRAPPRGLASDQYGLCKRYLETGRCTFGEKCTMAHSEAEMDEWNHRYAVRKQQLQQSHGTRAQGGTVIEQLMEKLEEQPKFVVVENMDLVKIHVNSDLNVNMTTKKCTNAWTFTVTSKLSLQCLALMLDTNRSYFHISSISVGPRKTQKYQNLENVCQEWSNQDMHGKSQGEYVYRIKVVFKTDIYGTFRQMIVFDFGVESLLMRRVQVESAPASDAEKVRKEITLTEAHRWNEKTVQLVNFDPRPTSHSGAEEAMMTKYTLPRLDKFCQPETVMHSLSKDNYRQWMHEMLYIEEMEQVRYISRFNVATNLQLVNRFLLMPSTLSTAKYAHDGELFARMKLEDDLSEDSMGGRLVLQSSHVAWVAEAKKERPEKVYEAVIEDKGKNFIFMRLSKTCVEELGLSCDQEFHAKIQFQLNRLPMCERHSAVDRLPSLDIVFPELDGMPNKLDLDDSVLQEPNETKRLNEKQKDAVRLILAKSDVKLPPLLIVGPFGTGKTFTMAQAAKQVLKQEGTRILICTHSNSAADLYIKEFLHSYVDEEDHAEARPLRVMYKFRWIQTVPEVVLDYTLLEREGPHAGTFRSPTKEDVLAHRVIIATLSSARYVVDLDLPEDTFSHIFIDEAAQSLESETLIPLSVAHEGTRIVFAGDHMQMSPEVYSDFTRQQGFHTSLLERLHELYPKECVYKVMLCENYRAHAAIIDFTSELFYDNKLISSGNIEAHKEFYPLTFYAAKGEEIQHENNTGFYNMSEVYEIVERVDELKKKWPESWGAFDNNGVSIVAPYIDQVARIRQELRKRKLFNVNVERVLNVQGKQYRVILLSITRTRHTCRSEPPNVEEYLDFGFLSNIKLLNTAITRAQSLVVVVGDPVSVCLVGKCRKIWEYFLEICHLNDSLHGISWVPLREQLDRAELTKSFVLNPLAPEFVPQRMYHSPHAPQPSDHTMMFGQGAVGGLGPGAGFPAAHHHHHAYHPHFQHPHFAGYAPGYPGLLPGQPFPQALPPMYQQPLYVPYFPSLVPQPMYYPHGGFPRGLLPGKQMFGRLMGPGSTPGYPYTRGAVREGYPRGVLDMSRGGVRRGTPRHNLYYPRGAATAAMPGFQPAGFPAHQPLIHPQTGGYVYQVPVEAQFPSHNAPAMPHPYLASSAAGLRAAQATAYGGMQRQALMRGGQSMVTRDRSDTADSSGSAGRSTDSPTSGIQLLANVKHVPPHLLSGQNDNGSPDNFIKLSVGGGTSGNNPVSQRSYSPANYSRDRSSSGDNVIRSFSPARYMRDRGSSGEEQGLSRGGSYSPSLHQREEIDVRSNSQRHGRSMSPSSPPRGNAFSQLYISNRTSNGGDASAVGDLPGNNNNSINRRKPNLKLQTGFSRQFSDDLPTPTVITKVFQMIDDNIDESAIDEEPAGASQSPSSQISLPSSEDSGGRRGTRPELKLKMTVAQRLQRRQATDDSELSLSATPPSAEDSVPTYAHMDDPISHLELQTPRTPKGFITPGTEMGEVDPFGILKSLNIGTGH